MSDSKVEVVDTGGCVVSGSGIATRDWYAWNNLMPPKPDDFHVVGEVQVPNPGVVPMLVPREPQGINPAIFLMDLVLRQRAGVWPQVLTWVPARYDKIIMNAIYTQVDIFSDGSNIASVPVHDVH